MSFPKPRSDRRIMSMYSTTMNDTTHKARVVKHKKYLRHTSCNTFEDGFDLGDDASPSGTSLKRRFEYQYTMERQKQMKLNQESDPLPFPSSQQGQKSADSANLIFYNNFLEFLEMVKDVTEDMIRFEYMQDLYQLDIDQFPQDSEAVKIQDGIIASTQVNSMKMKKNWNEEERSMLVWMVGKFCAWKGKDFRNIDDQDWVYLATLMNRRDSFSCKQKWLSMLKQQLFLAPWSTNEDENLKEIYLSFASQKKSNKWSSISNVVNQRMQSNVHRTGKQCRERWNNHLNPGLNREPWTDEEDLKLLQLILESGKKWALISKALDQKRNENAVKNRFNCLIKKETTNIQTNQQTQQQKKNLQNYSEDLSCQDLNSISQAIQKIEWRIQQRKELQSGGSLSPASSPNYSKILDKKEYIKSSSITKIMSKKRSSLDHMQLEDHQKGIFNLQHKLQGLTMDDANKLSLNLPSIDNLNTFQYNLSPDQISNATSEDYANCQPCLVNVKKDTIYFLSQEQMAEYIRIQLTPQFQFSPQQMVDECFFRLPQLKSHERVIFKTLNTIEEFSNQGSKASIGQYINSEFSQKRYNDEQDRIQVQQMDPKLVRPNSHHDSYQNIVERSDQRIFQRSDQRIQSNNKIPIKQNSILGNQINQPPTPIPHNTNLMHNINLFWPPRQLSTNEHQIQYPYQYMQPVPQWYTRGFAQTQISSNKAEPILHYNSQFQFQNRTSNHNYPAERPASLANIQD